jgi:hypothetical protein
MRHLKPNTWCSLVLGEGARWQGRSDIMQSRLGTKESHMLISKNFVFFRSTYLQYKLRWYFKNYIYNG